MNAEEFRSVLQAAIDGNRDAMEQVLIQYEPLIRKHSFIDGKFDEDLYQQLMLHIVKNIGKFSFR